MNLPDDRRRVAELWRRFSARPIDTSLRIALLAAHPDDETIGASTVLGRASHVRVIYLTDGAPRDQKLWSPQAKGTREQYAALRRAEAEQALACAGKSADQITWLGGADQEAIVEANRLIGGLCEALAGDPVEILITHSYEGGHPDHDAAALIAREALSNLEKHCLLLEMTSYHARHGRLEAGCFLDGSAEDETVFTLSNTDHDRKLCMMNAHASQREVLRGFPLVEERFRIAPAYDFLQLPHPGRLWYEAMGWGMCGAEWRSAAEEVLRARSEAACR